MASVKVENDRYTVDSLYQWDLNQVLEIYGLSLASIPEIHFTNETMDRAIVRQATMNAAGVISVEVPNSLLQKPYKITAYVCIYEGDTFRSLYAIVIPVTARKKPNDYTIEDNDGEIYSFNALENKVDNALALVNVKYDDINVKYADIIAKHKDITDKHTEIKKNYSEAIELVTHPPIIDESGYWMIWNNETNAYELTDYKAIGTDAYAPQKNVDYWTEEDKAEIKSYVDTAILGGAW